MSEKIDACWDIGLYCDCPHCDNYVNLLDYCDFWDGRRLDICECGTDRSIDVEVICPE